MDNLFERVKPRTGIDLNVVPIMDMLICVIFFLLLSTTFMGYTKLQVPPSSVTTITDPVRPEPLSPKMMAYIFDGQLQIRLEWKGQSPGSKTIPIAARDLVGRAKKVQDRTAEMIREFKRVYPSETTLQMALSAEIPYQILISMMDGARLLLPDVVLYSYTEVDARTRE